VGDAERQIGAARHVRRARETIRSSRRRSASHRPLGADPSTGSSGTRGLFLGRDVSSTQQHCLVSPIDGGNSLEGERPPSSEQSSAHNDLVGIVGVTLVANVIEASARTSVRVPDDIALGGREQPTDLTPVSRVTLDCSELLHVRILSGPRER
jgi:hypothetical protein